MGIGQYPDVFSICDRYSATMTETEITEAESLGRWSGCIMIGPEIWDFEYTLFLNPAWTVFVRSRET